MMIIRPVEPRDLDDILALAQQAGSGLTTLPQNREVLAARIIRSVMTWQGSAPRGEQGYLFVLEDSERQKTVGVSAIEVAVGLHEPWYNFRVGTLVHASKALNVYNVVPTLYLSNDHTGQSELCTLFLDPAYRQGKNGHLLMKARLMFMAAFRHHFGSRVIAEMRGYCDEAGNSPFWASLGQRFFSIDFAHADYLSGTGNKAFIAELMPKHPLYVDFLAPEAREAIGKVHPHTAPARAILESEGLRYQGYIDIFDGGPILEADIDQLRTLRDGRQLAVSICSSTEACRHRHWYLVANGNYQHFRATVCQTSPIDGALALTPETAAALGVADGECVRAVSLFPSAQAGSPGIASTRQAKPLYEA